MNRVFIGFDGRQCIAYTVLQQSIITRTDKPVTVAPLLLHTLPMTRQGLTPFTFSRFLVPWLCNFEGWALFLDVDILVKCDVDELFQMADPSKAVMVRRGPIDWEYASVMLFNCSHPDNQKLTPGYVQETKEPLHNIGWTEAIGDLPAEYNVLVGYEPMNPNGKIIHYTQGVACWPETQDCDYANDWQQEAQIAFSAQPWFQLMGNSKHAKPVYERLLRDGKIKGAAQ